MIKPKDLTGVSKYTFSELPDGFIVSAPERQATRVVLTGNYRWRVNDADDGEDESWRVSFVELLNLPYLIGVIASNLLRDWQADDRETHFNVQKWARNGLCRAIGKRVKAQQQRVLATVPGDDLSLLRDFYGKTLSSPPMLLHPLIRAERYLMSDIRRYRAAALTFSHLARGQYYEDETEDALRLIETMQQWRVLYSDCDKTYPALNTTLDHLPGGIGYYQISQLSSIHLERPITDRLELLCLLANAGTRPHLRHAHILMHARHDDLARAIQLFGRFQHATWSLRRSADIGEAMRLICDFPQEHHGNIVGLAQKSVEWHRGLAQRQIEWRLARYEDQTPLVPPPIPLPAHPAIRFLDTVGAVQKEGDTQGHCVGAYASEAEHGDCFLFHIDYRDNSATAQVNRNGKVVQCYGPRNQKNAASEWAQRELNKWGQTFPKAQPEVAPLELNTPLRQIDAVWNDDVIGF